MGTWYSCRFVDYAVKSIVLPLPPVKIQVKIVNDLSKKLAEVDKLVEIQQAQIEKLKEYKQLEICECVQNSLLKEAKIIKLKYICSSFNSNITAGELLQNNLLTPVYGASGLMGYSATLGQDEEYLGIIKDGAGVGRIKIYPKNSLLLGTMAYIFPNNGVNLSWLKYVIMSLKLSESLDKTTIPHIYFKDYGNKLVFYVDDSTQKDIVSYLDDKCSNIDKLIEIKQAKIEKLQEYKKSLIYEYVTGKKEVG